MVVLGRQRPFKRHRLIFFFNDHHLSSCRRPVNQGEMSVGSRRPTVSKQLRNYADNTPLSPGGKKNSTRLPPFRLRDRNSFPKFSTRFSTKKKKKNLLLDHRNFEILKRVRLGGKGGDAGFFFGRRSVIFLAPNYSS